MVQPSRVHVVQSKHNDVTAYKKILNFSTKPTKHLAKDANSRYKQLKA